MSTQDNIILSYYIYFRKKFPGEMLDWRLLFGENRSIIDLTFKSCPVRQERTVPCRKCRGAFCASERKQRTVVCCFVLHSYSLALSGQDCFLLFEIMMF